MLFVALKLLGSRSGRSGNRAPILRAQPARGKLSADVRTRPENETRALSGDACDCRRFRCTIQPGGERQRDPHTPNDTASGQESLAQMLYYLTHLSRQIVLLDQGKLFAPLHLTLFRVGGVVR